MTRTLQEGSSLGRYRVVSRLGAGGMGEVFLAVDTRLGRRVALKILHADTDADSARARRLVREAKTASALNHPNILTVYESDEVDDLHYIAAEFVEGETLRARILRGPLSPREALDVAVQVASALSAAHRAGVVHRDIKPENVMIRPDGYVKVLDFGIAKFMQTPEPTEGGAHTEEGLRTEQGVVLGTLQYMSPEQARGTGVDARTDVWSLGCVLYEMLAGRAPFRGPTKADLVASILHEEPSEVLPPGVAPELARVVMRALSKERAARYQMGDEMLADLRRARATLDASGHPAQYSQTGATLIHTAAVLAPPTTPDAHIAQQSTEQRRQVTVLFTDLSPLAERLESLDEEELGEVAGALWRRVGEVVSEHGGRVEWQLGDELMALWGASAAREDDPEKAVCAALALREQVAEFARASAGSSRFSSSSEDETPPVRVAVNTGSVLMGTTLTGELSATGAAVSAARRMKAEAATGTVLISHDTYRHVRGVFDVQEVRSARSRKDARPDAYVVLRAKPRAFRLRTRGVEGVETRMVGRKGELRRLTDALETVFEDGELQAVTLLGDSGLGKSRLLYEFSNKVELLPEVWYVFQGRASESTEGSPYALVRDLFSLRFEIQESDPPEEARAKLERGIVRMSLEAGVASEAEAAMRAHFIGQLAGLDFSSSGYLSGILDDARQIRERAFHYAAQFFSSVAATTPVLLMLDDIHWADEGSLDFIDHLTRGCAESRLMIVSAARPTLLERRPLWGEGHTGHTRITLQPLSKRESRQLVEEILRRAQNVPQELRDLVVSRAEGNPFYVEELIKMLIDKGAILPGAEEWEVDASRLVEVSVPATLTGVLQARLDGLSAAEKFVLQRASVFGREFWDAGVERLCAEDEGTQGSATYLAGHTRELLQSLRRKELIHQREASGLAGAGEYVFKHALLRDVTYETLLKRDRRRLHRCAAEWLGERSGVRAAEYAGAIAEHYERAEESARSAEWYGRAGRQARETHAPEAAVRFYRKAVEMLAAAKAAGGAEAESLAPRAAEWYEGLGEVLWRQALLDDALEAFDAMRAAARESADAAAEARAWNGRSLVEDGRGRTREALEAAREAERIARAGGETRESSAALITALLRQGYASYRLGDAATVVMLAEEALALSSQAGSKRDRARSLHLLGTAHQMLGDSSRALECKEQSLALVRELGDRQSSGAMLNGLGETARLRGDYEKAARFYQEALTIAREIGNLSQQLVYLGNLGGARMGLGEHAAAEADLREVVRLAGPTHFALSEVYRFLAEALVGQNKLEESLDAARYALSLGLKTGNLEFIGGAWRALGLVASRLTEPVKVDEGDARTAAECFAESVRVYAEAGMDSERARALRDWARYESARGDSARANAMLEEARGIFKRLGLDQELAQT